MNPDRRKTILFVEDQAIVAMAEAKTLKKNGFDVILANSGNDAVKIALENPTVNLVLMDIDLGKGMDGGETARIILKDREIPIVFLSNHTEKEIVDKTEKITSYGYVLKDAGETVLIATIKMAFRLFDAHSQLKLNEHKLREKEQRLRYALEGSSDGIWDWNLKTGEVYFSPRYYTMLGFEPNEFLPSYEKWVELLHPDDREKTLQEQRDAIEKLNPFEVEFRLRKKNGSYCWVLSRGMVTEKDKNGRAVRITGSHSDIENRKIAEQALIETQQMLRSVLNNIPIRVFWKDINSNYLGCNLPFALDAGLKSPEEIVGKDDFCMGWKDQAQLYRQDDHQVMISGMPKYNYEELQTRKDRKINWLRTNKIPLKDLDGNIIGVLGTYEDITEKKLAEEALRNNENKLKSIFKVAPIGIGVTASRVLIELNEYIYKMLGYSSAELIGQSARILYPTQEEFEFVGKEKYRQIEQFGTGSVETKWKCKDGRIIDVLLSSTPLSLKEISGGVIFTALDITQRKQTEELIKESEANLNSMINNRYESIWSIDKNYNYIILNNFFKETYLKTYGIELNKGMHALNILTTELKEFWKPKYDKALKGENVIFEITNMVKNELHYYEVSLDPIISDDKIIGVSGLSVDITSRKQAEQILKNAAAEKEALHRELLHRVKNSFNQIRALVYLERAKISDPIANNILEDIEMRIGTLSHLYSLLNESGISQQINLGEYLNQITDSLTQSYTENQEKIKVKIVFDKITISPKTASSVGLIVNEILTNSFKYAFPDNKKGKISVSLKTKNGNAEIEISDNGIGLPDNFNIEKSTGMGFQLINMLIQQLGGKLIVKSKKGTKYKFVFPLDE